jgi:hypothetical protein
MRLHLRPCALARPYRSCHNLALLATPRRAPAAAGSLVKNIKPPELLDPEVPHITLRVTVVGQFKDPSCWTTIHGSEDGALMRTQGDPDVSMDIHACMCLSVTARELRTACKNSNSIASSIAGITHFCELLSCDVVGKMSV